MDKLKEIHDNQELSQIDEESLFMHISEIIQKRKERARSYINQEVTLMYWEIGNYINSVLLEGERADYGKRIVSTLSKQLKEKYGKSFDYLNVRRMMQFSARFQNMEIVSPMAKQLSWSHIIELLPLKNDEAFIFYANDAAARQYGIRELRRQISRKAYERREIADIFKHLAFLKPAPQRLNKYGGSTYKYSESDSYGGRQVEISYDVLIKSAIDYDRNTVKSEYKRLLKEADSISSEIDEIFAGKIVEFNMAYDFNNTINELLEDMSA